MAQPAEYEYKVDKFANYVNVQELVELRAEYGWELYQYSDCYHSASICIIWRRLRE
jgi:hypothetical protein